MIAASSPVIVSRAGMRFIRLPRGVLSRAVHQTEIQTGGLFVLLIFGMPIAKDEIPALLVEIVIMLARSPAPFVGIGCRPRVPLSVSISAGGDDFRFIPKRVHQA